LRTRESDRASARHGLERRAPERKHDVKGRKQFMWPVRRSAESVTDAFHFNAAPKAGLANGEKGGRVGTPCIAIDQRPLHARARIAPLRKALEIDEIWDDCNSFGRDAGRHQTFPGQLADRHVATHGRESERSLEPGLPAVAHIHRRRLRKAQAGGGRVKKMLVRE
jgi:hypothetical protein